MDSIRLRNAELPATLVVVRLGTRTLDDDRLRAACQRCRARWGLWGFSVLEVPDGDNFGRLALLRPEVSERRQFLRADGVQLVEQGFPLLPTLDYPHWTVAIAIPTPALFERVRALFEGPIQNPAWRGAI